MAAAKTTTSIGRKDCDAVTPVYTGVVVVVVVVMVVVVVAVVWVVWCRGYTSPRRRKLSDEKTYSLHV